MVRHRFGRAFLLIAVGVAMFVPARTLGAAEILGADYRSDVDFPEHWPFWGTPGALGGVVHVFLRNPGTQAVSISDVFLEGISLNQAIAYSTQKRKGFIYAASIHFSSLSPAQIDTLVAAGEPVWWKAAPPEVPPGAAAEVTLRLRFAPTIGTLHVGVRAGAETLTNDIAVSPEPPKIESLCFAPSLDEVYFYLNHPDGGSAVPSRIFMDGLDVTAFARVAHDPGVNIVPVVLTLAAPLRDGSFHCFGAEYPGGERAMAGLRAYGHEFWYGMCGSRPGADLDYDLARDHIRDLHAHHINLQMPTLASAAVQSFLKTTEGQDLCQALGIGIMPVEPGKWGTRDAAGFYLVDEPDVGEYSLDGLTYNQKAGTLARGLLEYTEPYRDAEPDAPHLVNLDMTLKPYNWYAYGELPDVFCADPYYQARLTDAYWNRPERIPLYQKATYITAVGEVCRSACAPGPLFLLLLATRRTNDQDGTIRWPTTVEKRIELFYALGAGARGIGYWWFTTPNGCGSSDPRAVALWNEIGTLGLEIRTAGPAIIRSCPIDLPLRGPENVWLRSLAAGTDTVLILCVNDDYDCDIEGTNITPVENVWVATSLPSWLEPKHVFEINANGVWPAEWYFSDGDLDIHAGTVGVSRLFVVTSDSGVRDEMLRIYNDLSGQASNPSWLVD